MKSARLICGALLAVCVAEPALAQATPGAEELADIEQQLKDRAAEEARLKEEAEAREKEVAALRYRLIETANSLQEAERRGAGIETEIVRLEVEEREAEKALEAESENLADVLAALQSFERSRPPALLVSPEDANKAARAAMLLAEAAPALEAKAARLRGVLDSLAETRAKLAAEREALEKTNIELASRRDILADLLTQNEEKRDVAARLAAAAQRETARLAAQATSLKEVIRRLEKLAYSVTPRLKPPLQSDSPSVAAETPQARTIAPDRDPRPFKPAKAFGDARGALRPPVVGRVVGRYGQTRPEGGRFEGMRFAVRDQAIVTAPFEARVAFAQSWLPIGNLIVLDVGGGYHVLLMGVGAFLVEEDQHVAAGQPVAAMDGGGAGLDLEIRKDGEPVNPALWLSRKSIEEMAF
ncbi:MAG: murein hydrolase activator EnvC family protein [Parvularculaceae bacterium]